MPCTARRPSEARKSELGELPRHSTSNINSLLRRKSGNQVPAGVPILRSFNFIQFSTLKLKLALNFTNLATDGGKEVKFILKESGNYNKIKQQKCTTRTIPLLEYWGFISA